MKIAFVGKGGSGKTTLSSLFVRHLAVSGSPVVAVDADVNQHLGRPWGSPTRSARHCPRSAPSSRPSRSTCAGRTPASPTRRQ
jgi:CO dehydrogenase maturation factor